MTHRDDDSEFESSSGRRSQCKYSGTMDRVRGFFSYERIGPAVLSRSRKRVLLTALFFVFILAAGYRLTTGSSFFGSSGNSWSFNGSSGSGVVLEYEDTRVTPPPGAAARAVENKPQGLVLFDMKDRKNFTPEIFRRKQALLNRMAIGEYSKIPRHGAPPMIRWRPTDDVSRGAFQKTYDRERTRRCFAGRKIYFVGTSHQRTLFWEAISSLNGTAISTFPQDLIMIRSSSDDSCSKPGPAGINVEQCGMPMTKRWRHETLDIELLFRFKTYFNTPLVDAAILQDLEKEHFDLVLIEGGEWGWYSPRSAAHVPGTKREPPRPFEMQGAHAESTALFRGSFSFIAFSRRRKTLTPNPSRHYRASPRPHHNDGCFGLQRVLQCLL